MFVFSDILFYICKCIKNIYTMKMYRTADNKLIPILPDHVRTAGGNFKGVCVSACLSYFGIAPDQYRFTSSKKTGIHCYLNILRRFGWSVRSRKSTLIKGTKTVASVSKAIRAYKDYVEDTMYLVHVSGHVLLMNSQGKVVVDTAPRKVDRRRVFTVTAVFKD